MRERKSCSMPFWILVLLAPCLAVVSVHRDSETHAQDQACQGGSLSDNSTCFDQSHDRELLQRNASRSAAVLKHGLQLLSANSSAPLPESLTYVGSLSLDPTSCTEAVLVEPRALNYTAVPLQSALGVPGIDLITLAHGRDNGLFSNKLVDGSKDLAEAYWSGMLRLLPLPVGDLGGGGVWHHDYTNLLVSPRFWNLLHCNRVLIFQSDTVLCRRSPVSINEFEEFPYVGGHSPGMHAGLGRIHMNGGISLRSRPAMLECIEHDMHDEVLHSGYGEDEIFSRCRSLKQPPVWLADRFAIDNAAKLPGLAPPLGVHKPWAGQFAQQVTQVCAGAKELKDAIDKEVL